MKLLTQDDRRFIRFAMDYFSLKIVKLKWSPDKKPYPDIWCTDGALPMIFVTREWKQQSPTERKKRIVHEFIHIFGVEGHNDSIGYSTFPDKDTLSQRVYDDIMSGARKFDKRRFGL